MSQVACHSSPFRVHARNDAGRHHHRHPRGLGHSQNRGPWRAGAHKAAYADVHGGIKTALDAYEVDNGFYPRSMQDLIQQPSNARNWHGPYLDPPQLPVDPWGNPYVYYFPGKHNPDGYDLLSVGPDGKEGTDDDIVSWLN